MFILGCWIFLILFTSACSLEVVKDGGHEVTCSQGLSNCTVMDVLPPSLPNNEAFDVVNLTPGFKLCCKAQRGAPCTLCMAVDVEMELSRDEEISSSEQLEDSEDTSNTKASVTVCYAGANALAVCKQVEFTVHPTRREAKVSMVVRQLAGVTFGSQVVVYSAGRPHVRRQVYAPSVGEACSQEMSGRLEECDVPKVSAVINAETYQVDLQPADGEKSFPSVCVQQESDGRCQRWNRMNISLRSVTPCTCFQAWYDNDQGQRRIQMCPFNSTDLFMRNVWENVSVSVVQAEMIDGRPMLRWTLSAPCRLDGEVWPCCPLRGCAELQGHRQHLGNGTWKQDLRGHWKRTGVFENLRLQLPPCLMVKVRGSGSQHGPYCNGTASRWRWTVLIVGATLLLCLTVLVSYLTRNFVKQWVWMWRRGTFVKIGRQTPVLLLSPPDVDDGVSERMCELGSLLRQQGFGVTLDSCCRKEQCDFGPIPWFHSQMMTMKTQEGRAVLVLTRAAVERALEWELQDRIKEEEGDHPHSAVFKSSLFLIKTDQQLGRAGECFVLVTFESDLCSKSRLPELLLGPKLFQLPSQTKALLTELAVGGRDTGTRQRALRNRDVTTPSKSEMKPFICL